MRVSPFFSRSDSDMDLPSPQPIADERDHIYERGCQATSRERERASECVRKREGNGGREKIAVLLPRGEEKSEQDGLIAFHR